MLFFDNFSQIYLYGNKNANKPMDTIYCKFCKSTLLEDGVQQKRNKNKKNGENYQKIDEDTVKRTNNTTFCFIKPIYKIRKEMELSQDTTTVLSCRGPFPKEQ
jgi:chromosome segregation and condensation protein ScpB